MADTATDLPPRNGRTRNSGATQRARKATTGSISPPPQGKEPIYTSSSLGKPLPRGFGEAVRSLEDAIGLPVWTLVQTGAERPLGLYGPVLEMFMDAREELASHGHVALLIDSPGGLAPVAYRIARILQRDQGFTVVIPRFAKSAATLISLGAVKAVMGEDAEIGPLDAQLWDEEREEQGSPLDEVQALDQLHSVALQHLDRTMTTMVGGTKKKTDVLLPIAAKFVGEMMCPMLEKIDAVHYAKQARILAVAEHYAIRLLVLAGATEERARVVADALVNRYPEHGFVIDRHEVEAKQFLPITRVTEDVGNAVGMVEKALRSSHVTAVGRIMETK